jgi:hypothetical protein
MPLVSSINFLPSVTMPLAFRFLAQQLEGLFQVADMLLGLADMRGDHRLELLVLGVLQHELLALQELMLGVINIAKLVDELILQAVDGHLGNLLVASFGATYFGPRSHIVERRAHAQRSKSRARSVALARLPLAKMGRACYNKELCAARIPRDRQ